MKHLLAVGSALAFALTTATAAATPGDVLRTVSMPTGAPHHATYPLGIGVGHDTLFVANIGEAKNPSSPFVVFVLDVGDGTVRDRIEYPSDPVNMQTLQKLTWDGSRLWAVDFFKEVRRIDPATGENVLAYQTPESWSRGIEWDAGCGLLWDVVGHEGQSKDTPSHALHLRSENGEIQYTVETESDHHSWYGIAHDGCSLWSADLESAELVRLDITTGQELDRLAAPADNPIGLAWDGQALLVSDYVTDTVYAVEVGPAMLEEGLCEPALAPITCLAPGLPTVAQGEPPGSGPEPGGAAADAPDSDPPPPAMPEDDPSTSEASSSSGGCQLSPAEEHRAAMISALLLACAVLTHRRRRPTLHPSSRCTPVG